MKISDFLCPEAICADLKGSEKEEIISELMELLVKAEIVERRNKGKILEVLMAREALGSTAIGQGIAIPHGKCDSVKKMVGIR